MNGLWRDVKRVLCVRLDNMGDVLMTTPAIRALRESAAQPIHLTLLGSTAGCEVARQVPEIDAVLAYDAPWVAAGKDQPLQVGIAARLASYRFDAAVIFTCYTQSALPAAMICALAGIPLRLAHCRENPYALLTDWVRESEPDVGIRHEVERQLALVATVGAATIDARLSLRVQPAAWQQAATALQAAGLDPDRPFVTMHPGATAASRRWPAERFGQLAAAIHRRTGLPIVLGGTAGERDLTARVRAVALAELQDVDEAVVDVAGRLPLPETVALIAEAALVVSNNSGPVHIAAACDTPVVDLYALTNPQHTPWQVRSRVLSYDVPCRNCQRSVCPEGHHACLTGVTVDEACDAAIALLDDYGVPTAPFVESTSSSAPPFALPSPVAC